MSSFFEHAIHYNYGGGYCGSCFHFDRLYILTSVPSQDYSLDVDAMKDQQSLFVNSRIILTNTGRLPLTHILVDFGNKSESIIEILPEKVSCISSRGTQLRM